MSARLAQLAARRIALQAECELQRGDVRLLYGGIEDRAGHADRVIETVRSFAPAIAVGGVALLFVLGPGRAIRLLRRGFAISVYASQAIRMLR